MRFLVVFLALALSPQADATTYIRDYTYQASEVDSKISSRAIALDQVKLLLLQEIGTHIRQQVSMSRDEEGNVVGEEDIEAITAGLTQVEIVEEKWNGETYYLKARIDADTDQVLDALEEFKKLRDGEIQKSYEQQVEINRQHEELIETQRHLRTSRNEITRLKNDLKQARSRLRQQQIVENYNAAVDALGIEQAYEKSKSLYRGGDKEAATQLVRMLAGKGHARSENALGVMYERGLYAERDYAKALHWYEKASLHGNTNAINNLASLYYNGKGVERDYARALYWYRKAADAGNGAAQFNLGLMYQQGKGVDKDDRLAVNWYRKAADAGDAKGQYNLAAMYFTGVGVEKDLEKAIHWSRVAAESGLERAAATLGDVYRRGLGVEQDLAEALRWYEKSAGKGHAESQYNLGAMHERGMGVTRDRDKAAHWYSQAAANGIDKARDKLAALCQVGAKSACVK